MVNDTNAPRFLARLCNRCGLCIKVCLSGFLKLTDEGPACTSPDKCDGCAKCEEACAKGAIEVPFVIVSESKLSGSREE